MVNLNQFVNIISVKFAVIALSVQTQKKIRNDGGMYVIVTKLPYGSA